MYLTKFVADNIGFLTQLFEEGNLKLWDGLRLEFHSINDFQITHFQCLQLTHAIPHKANIKQNPGNVRNLLIQDHHLIKGRQILTLEKLFSKGFYSVLITKFKNKSSSNVYL